MPGVLKEDFFRHVQEGFLANQKKPLTIGNGFLKYDVRNGMFELITKSYAMMNCDMDFTLYPFDTQWCYFSMVPEKNLTYQE